MYSKLWEWEVNSFFIKSSINSLIHTEKYVPVIRTIHPYADFYIYTAGGKFLIQ